MRRSWILWGLMLAVCLTGCSGATVGTETAARQFFDAEFKKWMGGQDNEVATTMSQIQGHLNPIGYDVRSVVPDKPDFLAKAEGKNLPEDWGKWPAFRFNVVIETKSQADTPLKKITTYTLTWNAVEKRWYVRELFL